MKNKTTFNWMCPHCNKRNLSSYKFQFDVPKQYNVGEDCSKCGRESIITFELYVTLK